MRLIKITKIPGNRSWTTSFKSGKGDTLPGRFQPVRDPERNPQTDDSQRKVKRFYERDRPMAYADSVCIPFGPGNQRLEIRKTTRSSRPCK